MHLILTTVVYTINVLGIFMDPFEFEGDYGQDMNPARQKVFDLVVSKEALARSMSPEKISNLKNSDESASQMNDKAYHEKLIVQATEIDREFGPRLSEVVTPELIEEITKKQAELRDVGFTDQNWHDILNFIEKYKDQKIFYFLRNNPNGLVFLDKILKDDAARNGENFDIPIIGSTQKLEGTNSFELKKRLIDSLFNKKKFNLVQSETAMKKILASLDSDYLQKYLGNTANNKDLEAFISPVGQVFVYWMYQALNLQLVSSDPGLIEEVNKVKKLFVETLGNPESRAITFKNKFLTTDAGVVFTQESDMTFVDKMTMDGSFHPIGDQNKKDGTFVLLRSDIWKPDFIIIPMHAYDGYKDGKLSLILATQKDTGQKFLLAAGHGHDTRSEDGRLQISMIVEKFHELSAKEENANLQLLIGIDANTKNAESVRLLQEHLDKLGLISTNVGPTTIKRRMVTVQHSKVGRNAIDEEDYVITLKPEMGGQFLLTHSTVGFTEEKPNLEQPLPSIENPSDHYPVGVTLQ